VDADGTRYLFYARRRARRVQRVGTMLAVDVLERMDRLAGRPTPVLAPTGDWQIFRRGRPMYGGVYDWHTLEGPFVRRMNDRYVLFYSGGNWEEPSYGVGWAEAEHPLGPWREHVGRPPLLRTVPGHVRRPRAQLRGSRAGRAGRRRLPRLGRRTRGPPALHRPDRLDADGPVSTARPGPRPTCSVRSRLRRSPLTHSADLHNPGRLRLWNTADAAVRGPP
jgi:hypothetical protein